MLAPFFPTAIADAMAAVLSASSGVFPFMISPTKYPVKVSPAASSRQITEAMQVELPRDLDEALAAWTREYHKNTGL